MDSPSALIALDQGTSVTRAALYREGRLVAEVRRPVSLHFPSPGRAEQDPRELLDVAREVLELCCEALEPGERAALGIAHQRSTIVLWDADNGRPFGPALSWRDSRARAESDELAARVKDLQQRTGLPATPHYGAPKIAWALDHWPEAAAAARSGRLRIGTVGSWLLWKLSMGEAFTIDPTNAQRLLLLDLRTLDWDETLLRAARVPEGALPSLRPTDGVFGDIRVGKHLLPVRAMLGDQQAALAGLGEQRPDTALVQLGTGGFVLVDTGSQARFLPGLLAGIARADANKERRYLVEGPVNSAGSALDRLRDLGILGESDDLCEVMALAANPVTLVPAWAGLAAPWWASGARAMLAGWDESTTRADIVAGTVRGIAFLVADILDFMTAAGLRISELELSGSLSQQACVAQAIADATHRRARVRVNPEGTLEGIALVLAEATGAVQPALSVSDGAVVEPSTDLAPARAAFATARQAATKLGRGEGEAP